MRKNSTPAVQTTNECRIKLKLSGSDKAEYVFPAMTSEQTKERQYAMCLPVATSSLALYYDGRDVFRSCIAHRIPDSFPKLN